MPNEITNKDKEIKKQMKTLLQQKKKKQELNSLITAEQQNGEDPVGLKNNITQTRKEMKKLEIEISDLMEQNNLLK